MKSRLNRLAAAMILAMAVWTTSSLVAAEYVFDLVPNDSLGVIIVNRLSSTESRIGKLCDNLQYPVPEPMKKISEMIQGDTGVDASGTAALVAMPNGGQFNMESGVVLIPVSDFDKFLNQFATDNANDKIIKATCKKTQTPVLIARKGGYAVLASPGGEATIEAFLKSDKSAAAAIAPWRGWLQSCDTAAVITSGGLAQFVNQSIAQMEEAKDMIDQAGKQMKPFAKVLDAAVKQLSSSEKEVRAAAVGVVLEDDGGVEIFHNLLFEPYGETSKFFAEVTPNRSHPLAGLPKGPFVMAVSGSIPKDLADMFGDLAADMLKASPASYGLDQKQADSLAEATEDMLEDVQGFSMMLGVPASNQPLATATHNVLWVADSQKFLSDYAAEIKTAISLAKQNGGKDAPLAKISINDAQIDGAKAIKVTVDLSALISKEGKSDQAAAIQSFYGPTGIMTAYVAAVDANTVVFCYGGQDAAQAAVAAVNNINDSLAGDSGVRAVNRYMLSGGQWVGYWSPSGTIDFINRMPGGWGMASDEQGKLPPFPTTMPVGMTVKAGAGGIVKAVYVPSEVVKAAGSYQNMLKDIVAKNASKSDQSDQDVYDSDQGEPSLYIEEDTYESGYPSSDESKSSNN